VQPERVRRCSLLISLYFAYALLSFFTRTSTRSTTKALCFSDRERSVESLVEQKDEAGDEENENEEHDTRVRFALDSNFG
jgi:hypothetical protein